jgi:hypothetical protein
VFVLHRDAAAPCDVQDAELAFCRELWRADAVGCAGIGRDLVRLLRLPVLAALPDAAAILADIAAGTVAGGAVKIPTVPELMLVKTPKRVLVSRIPPLLETQLLFLLRNVKLCTTAAEADGGCVRCCVRCCQVPVDAGERLARA